MLNRKLALGSVLLAAVILSWAFVSAFAADFDDAPTPKAEKGSAIVANGTENEGTDNSMDEPGKLNIQIGEYNFTAALEDNQAVRELVDILQSGPLTINMTDYSGFEKVGALGRSLTASDSQTTTEAGDIVLYNGNSIVMFYGSNSWSYTRIGQISDLTDWRKALGSGGITAVFSLP